MALEAVVLQIKALAGSAMDPRAFGFIDPPEPDSLEAAILSLKQASCWCWLRRCWRWRPCFVRSCARPCRPGMGGLAALLAPSSTRRARSPPGPGPRAPPQAGALTRGEALTPLGAVLSLLPVDVHTGKLLVLGGLLGLQEPAITMAAALAVQSPFVRLTESQQEAGVLERRRELMSPWGDPFTLLEVRGAAPGARGPGREAAGGAACARARLDPGYMPRPAPPRPAQPSPAQPSPARPPVHPQVFEAWLAIKSGLSRQWSSSSRWARAHGLQEQRLYEVAKLKRQFAELLEDAGGRAGG